MDIVKRLRDYSNNRGHMAMREVAASEILHWRGMTKGRESEIDKHLAEIERLRAALEELSTLPVNKDTDHLLGFAAAVHILAREALKQSEQVTTIP